MCGCLQAVPGPAGRAAHAEGLLPGDLEQQPLLRWPAQPRWRAAWGAQCCRACSAGSNRAGATGKIGCRLGCLLRRSKIFQQNCLAELNKIQQNLLQCNNRVRIKLRPSICRWAAVWPECWSLQWDTCNALQQHCTYWTNTGREAYCTDRLGAHQTLPGHNAALQRLSARNTAASLKSSQESPLVMTNLCCRRGSLGTGQGSSHHQSGDMRVTLRLVQVILLQQGVGAVSCTIC